MDRRAGEATPRPVFFVSGGGNHEEDGGWLVLTAASGLTAFLWLERERWILRRRRRNGKS
jgi:hypothetical protein